MRGTTTTAPRAARTNTMPVMVNASDIVFSFTKPRVSFSP
jgi:hypothetical protein